MPVVAIRQRMDVVDHSSVSWTFPVSRVVLFKILRGDKVLEGWQIKEFKLIIVPLHHGMGESQVVGRAHYDMQGKLE